MTTIHHVIFWPNDWINVGGVDELGTGKEVIGSFVNSFNLRPISLSNVILSMNARINRLNSVLLPIEVLESSIEDSMGVPI